MLQKNFPEISNRKKPTKIVCSGIPFTGSMHTDDTKRTDTLCDFVFNLPKPEITLNGNPISEYGNRALLTSENSGTNHSSTLYKEVFGTDSAEVIYEYTNDNRLNALIISDSYSNAIKPVLASHFNKTIFIDMRHYFHEYGDYFNLSDYISKHDIDFILYLGGFFTTTMDESYIINSY